MTDNDTNPPIKPTLKQQVHGDGVANSLQKPNEGDELSQEATLRFRPLRRPPMAVVCVLHDNGEGGEWFPLRGDKVTFGRTDADILIPHDEQISGLHAELSRKPERGAYHWYLKDLDSRNGTFVKAATARLTHNSELIVGCHRYRFDAAPQGSTAYDDSSQSPQTERKVTQGWQIPTQRDIDKLLPALVRITPEGDTERFTLPETDQTIGASPSQCDVVFTDDRMVSPVHCRVWQDAAKRWNIEDRKSLNGTWCQITKKRIDTNSEFQIGEQRILVKFP